MQNYRYCIFLFITYSFVDICLKCKFSGFSCRPGSLHRVEAGGGVVLVRSLLTPLPSASLAASSRERPNISCAMSQEALSSLTSSLTLAPAALNRPQDTFRRVRAVLESGCLKPTCFYLVCLWRLLHKLCKLRIPCWVSLTAGAADLNPHKHSS